MIFLDKTWWWRWK